MELAWVLLVALFPLFLSLSRGKAKSRRLDRGSGDANCTGGAVFAIGRATGLAADLLSVLFMAVKLKATRLLRAIFPQDSAVIDFAITRLGIANRFVGICTVEVRFAGLFDALMGLHIAVRLLGIGTVII